MKKQRELPLIICAFLIDNGAYAIYIRESTLIRQMHKHFTPS